MKSSRDAIARILRYWILVIVIMCVLPPVIFIAMEFSDGKEYMRHHMETVIALLKKSELAALAPYGDYKKLEQLLIDLVGKEYTYTQYDSSGRILSRYVADLSFPTVSSRFTLDGTNWSGIEVELSISLADKLPLMFGITAISILFLILLLRLFYSKIYLNWQLADRLEQRERTKLEIVSQLGSDLIWSTDASLRIDGATKKTGKEILSTSMIGSFLWNLPGLVPDKPWDSFIREMEARQEVTCKASYKIDAAPIYLEFSAKPKIDRAGSFQGYVGIVRDITYLLDREKELERQKNELTRMVDERSIDLLQAKLAAEEANATKSRFLSTMSHEIRTPLNSIVGLSNLLLKTNLSHKQRDYMETVISSSELLLTIINDILDISRIESGKHELVEKEFPLKTLVNDVTDLVRQRAVAKGLEIIYDIDDSLYSRKIIADHKRLSQALLNYMSNAIKFTNSGHIVIKVSLQDPIELQNGQLILKFSVRDTGIGITSEDQKKLFSLFSQVDNNYTRRFEGTGLGLYIVKNIVELMHGSVGMFSEPGFGSTFWFTAVVKAGAALDASQPALKPGQPLEMRVLLVDDNEDTRTVLSKGLGRKGVQVTCMATGETAMDFLQEQDSEGHPIQAVIMDWYLPGNNGVYFSRKIRALPLSVTPAILCLTSKDVAEMTSDDRDSFDDILTKPIDTQFLHDSLIRLCEQKHGRGAVAVVKNDDSARDKPLLANKRVLLVDDDKVGVKLAEIILTRQGATCVSCFNGKEAVQILENDHNFDIVLMDIEMPELDGISAIGILRQIPKLQSVCICMITAHAMHAELGTICKENNGGVLTKPYTVDQLIEFVKKWTSKHPNPTVERNEINEILLISILEQLRNGDPTVCDHVKLHIEDLRTVLQEETGDFMHAIDNYDFERSTKLLDSHISEYKKSKYSATFGMFME